MFLLFQTLLVTTVTKLETAFKEKPVSEHFNCVFDMK